MKAEVLDFVRESLGKAGINCERASEKTTEAAVMQRLLAAMGHLGAAAGAIAEDRRLRRVVARQMRRTRTVRKTLTALAKSGGPR